MIVDSDNETVPRHGIDRRSFLQSTAALTAVIWVGGCKAVESHASSEQQALTGTFTGQLGTVKSRLGSMVLGAV